MFTGTITKYKNKFFDNKKLEIEKTKQHGFRTKKEMNDNLLNIAGKSVKRFNMKMFTFEWRIAGWL